MRGDGVKLQSEILIREIVCDTVLGKRKVSQTGLWLSFLLLFAGGLIVGTPLTIQFLSH